MVVKDRRDKWKRTKMTVTIVNGSRMRFIKREASASFSEA